MMMSQRCVLALLAVVLLAGAAQSFQLPQQISVSSRSATTIRANGLRTRTVLVSSSLDEELPKFNNDIVPKVEDEADNGSKKKSSNSNSNEGLVARFNELGMSLKPKAQQVDLKAAQASKMKRKIGLKAKACLYWTLYMAYRGYRGFFVILPAVFREVYLKMENAVDFRVLDDESDYDNTTAGLSAAAVAGGGPVDINPATGKVRWRTKITVSVLAGIVTLTYVMGGLARVLMKFTKTILRTSSLSGSFSAAADEVEGNEGRLMRLTGDDDTKKKDGRNVNGRKGGGGTGRNVAF